VDVRIPLFPLGTVLFPGAVLPLRIFEERYRRLVRDLLDGPEPRRFGVVAIELGHEVGPGAARRLASVGCTAVLRRVVPYEDGRFDIVSVGGQRFRITEVDDAPSYPRAAVTLLPDEPGAGPGDAVARVSRLFPRYLRQLAAAGRQATDSVPSSSEPIALSYAVAGALVVGRHDKQRLLEAADATVRLGLAADLLAREIKLLSKLPTVPAPHFRSTDTNPN
jgi:Lon protease-like protein